MPDIGLPELILLLAIVLLLFGPGKLPEVGKSLGNAIREFRKATSDVQEAVRVDQPAGQAQAQPAAQAAPAPTPQPAPAAQPAPQAAPDQAPAPNTLSGGVAPNTLAEPGSEGTPRA